MFSHTHHTVRRAKITDISYVAKDRLNTDGVLEVEFPSVSIMEADVTLMKAIIRPIAGWAQVGSNHSKR